MWASGDKASSMGNLLRPVLSLIVLHQRKTTKWRLPNYWINEKSLYIWDYNFFGGGVHTFVPTHVRKSLWKCDIQYLALINTGWSRDAGINICTVSCTTVWSTLRKNICQDKGKNLREAQGTPSFPYSPQCCSFPSQGGAFWYSLTWAHLIS